MFKCKIKLEELVNKNQRALEIEKTKSLSKAAVKKLARIEDGKAPFYIIKNYFKKEGDPIGDFIAFGIDKNMHLQFSKKEVKGKGISDSSKDAAFGNAYIKSVEGKKIIHFEPDSSCKIAAGAWPKLLKRLKSNLPALKAVVVINGKPVEEDDDKGTEQTSETTNKMEYKAIVAEKLLNEVETITKIYDREKKETLKRKTEKWLNEYSNLSEVDKTDVLRAHFLKIIDANKQVIGVLQKDDQITLLANQIFEAIEKYLSIDDHKSTPAKNLADKIIAALNKIIPIIEKVKDKELLEEMKQIKEVLNS